MSHELRSPLNAIMGFTHILRNDDLSPVQTENLDIIYSSSEHLLALINDILDISKIEAGRVVLTHSEFDLYRLIDELQQMFGGVVAEKDLSLKVVRSPHLPRIIYSDRLKLRQILINLLSNAVKFTATGTITLSVSGLADDSADVSVDSFLESSLELPTLLTFSVTDTGTGIDPAEQDRLFEAFVQTKSALTAQQGTGLGLTISQEYVRLLGGQLSVKSVPGEGSTFAFSISVKPVDSSSVQAPPATAAARGKIVGLAAGQPQYRILVVDDVALNRRLLTHLLSSVGFDVQEASDGKAAIALWQRWSPDLIWMDIRMPIMSGEEAALRIKSLDTDQKTRILALTANAFDEDRTAALASGCDDFISKPIQAAEIFDKISLHLGVRYRYADSQSLDEHLTDEPASRPLTADLLTNTTPEWRYHLTQAVLDLDDSEILSLTSQLSSSQQPLARAIERQVDNLSYKKLLQVLQEADAVSP
ncbi:MAG: response regulator [Phormidesmis sp.]